MSIFKRVRDITMAAINEALEYVEEPISMLNQYMRDMEDEMARQALSDKQLGEARLEEFNQQYGTLVEQNKALRQQLQELKDKYYEMKNKSIYLLSRANAAETKQRLNQAMRIETQSAASGFARMKEKIMALEVQANAGQVIYHSFRHPLSKRQRTMLWNRNWNV